MKFMLHFFTKSCRSQADPKSKRGQDRKAAVNIKQLRFVGQCLQVGSTSSLILPGGAALEPPALSAGLRVPAELPCCSLTLQLQQI